MYSTPIPPSPSQCLVNRTVWGTGPHSPDSHTQQLCLACCCIIHGRRPGLASGPSWTTDPSLRGCEGHSQDTMRSSHSREDWTKGSSPSTQCREGKEASLQRALGSPETLPISSTASSHILDLKSSLRSTLWEPPSTPPCLRPQRPLLEFLQQVLLPRGAGVLLSV